jgi:hypothetical protein
MGDPFHANIVYVRQQFEGFAAVGAIAQARWSLGAKSVDVSQVPFKSVTLKKQKGIEGLVLCGRRDATHSEFGQKRFELGLSCKQRFALWRVKKLSEVTKTACSHSQACQSSREMVT